MLKNFLQSFKKQKEPKPSGPITTAGERGTNVGGSADAVVTGDNNIVDNSRTHVENQYAAPQAKVDAGPLRRAYLNRVLEKSAILTLSGIDRKTAGDADARLELTSVYTALLTLSADQKEHEPHKRLEQEKLLSATAMLDRHSRLVLLGDPGSGKSTFVNFTAACMAGELLAHETVNLDRLTAPLPDNNGNDVKERQPWGLGPLLPVKVILRDFVAGLPGETAAASLEHLWEYIAEDLKSVKLEDFAPLLEEELRGQGGLLLLDGLDEVPEPNHRRAQIIAMVEDLASTLPKCRLLVTSRTYAYRRQNWRIPGLAETVLAPFSPGQIRRFIEWPYLKNGDSGSNSKSGDVTQTFSFSGHASVTGATIRAFSIPRSFMAFQKPLVTRGAEDALHSIATVSRPFFKIKSISEPVDVR